MRQRAGKRGQAEEKREGEREGGKEGGRDGGEKERGPRVLKARHGYLSRAEAGQLTPGHCPLIPLPISRISGVDRARVLQECALGRNSKHV